MTIRIALWPLVTGTLVFRELLVDDVIMAVELAAEAEDDDHRGSSRKTLPDIQVPIFESVRLHNIQLDVIDTAANRRVEVRLRQFSIDDIRDTGSVASLSKTDAVYIDGIDLTAVARDFPLATTIRPARTQPVVFGAAERSFSDRGQFAATVHFQGRSDNLITAGFKD